MTVRPHRTKSGRQDEFLRRRRQPGRKDFITRLSRPSLCYTSAENCLPVSDGVGSEHWPVESWAPTITISGRRFATRTSSRPSKRRYLGGLRIVLGRPIVWLAAAGLFLLLLSGVILATANWSAPLTDRRPESLFSAGPLQSGDSISQRFESPAAFLSRAEVRIRTDGEESENEPFQLIFRLFQESLVVREGRVEV
jgi:hypothetical protein